MAKNTVHIHRCFTWRLIEILLILFTAALLSGCAPGPSRLTTGPLIEFHYYYGSNCPLCQEFLNVTVPQLEHRLGARLAVIPRDGLEPDNLKEYKARMKKLGVKAVDLPSVIL